MSLLTFYNCDAVALMTFKVACYFIPDITTIITLKLESSIQMKILNVCMLIRLLLSELHNDDKWQQHWPAHNKTETGDLKSRCLSSTSPFQSDSGPDEHRVRNPPWAAKSWNQPIFHAVVCENTSCCGLSWTWALTQSTSLCITRALGFVCIGKDGEVEREAFAGICLCTGLMGLVCALEKTLGL